jgi:hypothetical protein
MPLLVVLWKRNVEIGLLVYLGLVLVRAFRLYMVRCLRPCLGSMFGGACRW